MKDHTTTYVGMDVHQDSLAIAVLAPGAQRPASFTVPNTPAKIRRLIRKLKRDAKGELHCCYEAGPAGFTLSRQFTAAKVRCDVIAPSMTPHKPGERVKTDRIDAAKLAHYLRSGDLTVVRAPDEADEAARDVCRAREAMRRDRLRLRQRVLGLLSRRGLVYREGCHWTRGPLRWLRAIELDPRVREVLDDLLLALEQIAMRIDTSEDRIAQLAGNKRWKAPAAILRCYRGIDTHAAMLILTEMHSAQRFLTPRSLMHYAGLTGSEHSTGTRVRRGPLTRTGNTHLRRILVEAAWHYWRPVRVCAALRKRRAGAPAAAIARADKFMQRAHRRYWHMTAHGKAPGKAICAIARELAGSLWAALRSPAPQA